MPLLKKPAHPTNLELTFEENGAVQQGGRLLSSVRDLRAGFKAKNFLYSLSFAWEGLVYVTKTQRNFRAHLFMGSMALTLATVFHVTVVEWAILWGVIGIVLFAELMNTVIELFVDMVTQGRYDLRAKAIKDMAAGAVFVTAISALACGVCIFVPHIVAALHVAS
jgi:diacylglycerol kinase